MKIIVPLRTKTFSRLKRLIEQVNYRADVIEVWLDEVYQEPDFFEKLKDYLDELSYRAEVPKKLKFIGVCKCPVGKGNFEGTESERLEILKKFLAAGGDLVDMDVTLNLPELIEQIPPDQLICSFHDFEGMPGNMNNIFILEQKFNPKVYKFAVTPQTEEELGQFIWFAKNFPSDKKGIFTTMGKYGAEGRARIDEIKAIWGQFYALDEDSRTAEGQPVLN